MTRKDYVLLAGPLKQAAADEVSNGGHLSFGWVKHNIDDMADALAQDNPRFNRATFLLACKRDA